MMKRLMMTIVIAGIMILGGALIAQDGETLYTQAQVNLRDCPQLSCAVVMSLAKATAVTDLGIETGEAVDENEDWHHVATEEAEGYVHSSLLDRYEPDFWKALPVVPEITDTAREIYAAGLAMENDIEAFSVVGDCQNVSEFFLSPFSSPAQYDLGEYSALQSTIDYYADSFSRERAAVRGGYNVASVLSPMWADPETCEKGENPLSCENRLHNPSVVLISMETWWEGRPADSYEVYLRQVVEYWISEGVVPILATKADNLEGNHGINAAIARVALDYDVPLWNFWASVQDLPNNGLEDDLFHLTYGSSYFNDSGAMQTGWAMRNLTALQVLDAVRLGLEEN